MQIDFHYYCIFVLANLAGFSQEDAKTIAYSSQFVDDSRDSKRIKIKDYAYDTVRTAHNSIYFYKWNVQKKIYFPFHFIPPEVLKNNGSFSYVTKPNSNFAQMVIDEAINDQTDLRLYRMGVALHTYADTWAHQNFSGRKHRENNTENFANVKMANGRIANDY